MKATHEEHSQWITDVRFSPSMSRLATSSADKTVRVWDAENVSKPFFHALFRIENIHCSSILVESWTFFSLMRKFSGPLSGLILTGF